MLVNLLIMILIAFIQIISIILPNWSIPENALLAWQSMTGVALLLNGFIPIIAFVEVLLVIIVFESTLLAVRAGLSIITIIRGGGRFEI